MSNGEKQVVHTMHRRLNTGANHCDCNVPMSGANRVYLAFPSSTLNRLSDRGNMSEYNRIAVCNSVAILCFYGNCVSATVCAVCVSINRPFLKPRFWCSESRRGPAAWLRLSGDCLGEVPDDAKNASAKS